VEALLSTMESIHLSALPIGEEAKVNKKQTVMV
jgi:hypothetical protein